jgi:hypothetical protein
MSMTQSEFSILHPFCRFKGIWSCVIPNEEANVYSSVNILQGSVAKLQAVLADLDWFEPHSAAALHVQWAIDLLEEAAAGDRPGATVDSGVE